MTSPSILPPPLRRGFALRGLATLGACLLIAALLATLGGGHFATALVFSCAIGLLCWLVLDGGRLLLARLQHRWRPDDEAARSGWPGWPVMAALIVVGSSVAYVAGNWIGALLTGNTGQAHDIDRGFVLMLLVSISVGSVITAFYYASARLEHSRTEAESARRLAAEAELRLLQSQLEPHMLFNTLANLRVLIGLNPPRAQAMLDRLIAFLRATLTASRQPWHPLADEFARLDDYLALMAVRMGARLQVELDLPADLQALSVPPLLLQPLVENAVKHGLEPQVQGGRLTVRAARHGDQLQLTVRDTGVGLAAPSASGTRFGLQQVRDRLQALYGAGARLSLAPATDAQGGTLATIVLPLVP
jgi:sensor histidine kinase YesM